MQPFIRTCYMIMQLALISKVCLCAQVDIAQLYKALGGLLSWNGGSQVEIGAHKVVIKAMTWIVDEAETEESAAEVSHLNTIVTRLCSERSRDE